MSFFRKSAAMLGRAWGATFGVKPWAVNVPPRWTGLPDPVIRRRRARRVRTAWDGYRAKAIARRRRANKVARKSRAVNRKNGSQ
jgi:hypothetical protein